MLDISLKPVILQENWQLLREVAQLPCDPDDFMSGAIQLVDDSRRSHQRIPMRGRAVMVKGEESYGIYTLDVSPKGMGFFSPVQLFPNQKVQVSFAQWGEITLKLMRCRREQSRCFLCGTHFFPGALSAGEYRDLLRSFR